MTKKLESEFSRVGNDKLGSGSSIVVVAVEIDGELWATYYDDAVRRYCRAKRLLETLRELPNDYFDGFEDTEFWQDLPDDEDADRDAILEACGKQYTR